MEKDELLAWEHKCIQEEPPECTAACPIHVDARLFVKEIGRGDWEAALKVLRKTMPFPGILGRICDHPCEANCKRREAGEPISIGLLERICMEKATGSGRVVPLPRKDHRIAVIGSSFAGLTAAWDLLKKGMTVAVFERSDRLGGFLWDYSRDLLPSEVIREELSVLDSLKADIRLESSLDGALFEGICRDFDAVFIDREAVDGCDLPLGRDDAGEIAANPLTGATDREKVYAGGGTKRRGHCSPVTEAREGRRGALSIERFLQKVHIEVGRENEGPFTTRLFTSLDGVEPLSRFKPRDAVTGYSEEEARRESSRCIQCECMECVKVCLYLERYKGYPKKYARQVFNNERVIFGASRTANRFVNSCSACGLCETVCPNDFFMGDLCLQARRTMNEQKFMPPSFHEFALQDMAHSNGERFAFCRHEPGRKESAWLYFPSCQLSATSPGEVLASYRYLRERLTGGVGIMLRCCGAPAFWAGRGDLFRESLDEIRSGWEGLGKPRLITACATCRSLFSDHLPEMETHSLWSIIEESGFPGSAVYSGADGPGKAVAVVDPCITRHDRETRESVRRLVGALGLAVEELPLSGEKPECCGFGGLMFNADPVLARDVIARRVAVSGNDYLAYCAMCRDNFAAAGKRVCHLIELLFPTVSGGDPASRGWLSWSERRENRARVKGEILRDCGEEGGGKMAAHEGIKLNMTEDVRRRIDQRRILEDDIRKVIAHGERSGKRLKDIRTGHYRACLQPENVTFWVDYSLGDEGFTVHNAYCHRMKIVGIKQ